MKTDGLETAQNTLATTVQGLQLFKLHQTSINVKVEPLNRLKVPGEAVTSMFKVCLDKLSLFFIFLVSVWFWSEI